MDEDLREKLTKIIEGYAEIEEKLGDPAVLADQREYTRLSKEFANQAALVGKANDYLQACRDIDDCGRWAACRQVSANSRVRARL